MAAAEPAAPSSLAGGGEVLWQRRVARRVVMEEHVSVPGCGMLSEFSILAQ